MTKERCNCAAGPWYLSSDKEPPRDGTLILGQWDFGTMTVWWNITDKGWLKDDYMYPLKLIEKDPIRWAEIR